MLHWFRRFRLRSAAALAAGAALGTGCGAGADLGISSVLVVASVEVSPGSLTLVSNQTHAFVATPRTSSGVPITGRAVAWSSSDPAVASVASDGTVSAITPGTARIGARIDNVTGFADLTVSAVPVNRVQLLPASTTVVIGATVQLTANLYDAAGGVLSPRPIAWSSSETLIATVSVDGLVTTHGVGQVTITATVEGKVGSATITVGPRPAVKLGFLTPPTEAAAGALFAPAVRVAIQDVTGATVSSATGTVTLALAGGPAGATLAGTVSAAAVNGVATFADLSMTKAGTGYTLTATSTATGVAAATSAPFVIRAAAAAALAITTQPAASGVSGAPLVPQPVVRIIDRFANPVPQGATTITASLASGTGTLSGATTATGSDGSAAFGALAISGVAGTYTLDFSATGLTGVTSAPVILGAGSGSRLAFTSAPPATAVNGQPFGSPVAVALRDATGNPVAQAGIAITASIGSGAGTLSGPPLTATTDATGTATFAGLVITGTAGPYTLVFSGTGINPLTSSPIQLAAGSASKLVLAVAPPASATGGQPLTPAPVVQITDGSGNPVATAGVQVTATLATGSGTLSGATATTDAAGRATFSALTISGPAGSYSLAFAAAGLTGVTSGSITLSGTVATQITFTVAPPASAANGQPLAPQPVLQLRDAGGSAVSLAGVQVTATVSGLTVAGGTATTNASGAATFSTLALSGIAGNYNLVFTATGVSGTASSQIALVAGPASQLTFTTAPPATATNGQDLSVAPVLQLRDASGNAVSQSGVTVSVAIASGPGGTLSGQLTASTDNAGAATFPNLRITGKTGSYVLAFSATGLSTATSNPITLVGGSPAGMTFATAPPANATNGVPLSPQPVVQLVDASGNASPTSGVSVSVTLQAASGTQLLGTTTATTNAAGQAAFTNLELRGTVGSYSLSFSSSGLPDLVSGPIQLVAGAPSSIALTSQPSPTAQNDQPFSQQPVVAVTDASGNPVSGATVTASIATGPGGTLTGTATVATNSSGVAGFSGLAIVGTVGDYTLRFAAGALSVTSTNVALSAGVATKLVITQEPSNVPLDVAISPPPTVELRDSGNNLVSLDGRLVIVSIASGNGTLSPVSTLIVSTAGGVATFTNIRFILDGQGNGNHKLQFSSLGVTSAVSATFKVN